MGRITIKNTTSYPTETVSKMLGLIELRGIPTPLNIVIKNKKRGSFTGRAYLCMDQININLNTNARYPLSTVGGDGYLPFKYRSLDEAVMHILSHEMRHFWQKSHTNGKVWGAKGTYSERDADAYAIKMVRTWRKANRSVCYCYPNVLDCP